MTLTSEHVTEIAGGREAGGVLAPLLAGCRGRVDHVRDQPLFQRDPEFLRRQLPAVTRYVNYFSPEVRGQVNLPASGPALVVGNHSGLFYMPDAWVVGLEIVRRRGLDQPAYAMGYDMLFGIPGVGPFMRRIGAIPAGGQAAEQGLAEGGLVVSVPGRRPRGVSAVDSTATRSTWVAIGDSFAWHSEPAYPWCRWWPTGHTMRSSSSRAASAWRKPSAWSASGSRCSPSSSPPTA